MESKRDHLVYAPYRNALETKINRILTSPSNVAIEEFNETPKNGVASAKQRGWDPSEVRLAAYRPLDLRWHYSDPRWNDRPRKPLHDAWGDNNLCLFSLPGGFGTGPAVWTHGAFPDRHAFRGSYGGYAFPMYDRRIGPSVSNVSPNLLAALSAAYGREIAAEDAFDVILCLLSASSYTSRFAEDLEDVFPHVPFPVEHSLFDACTRVGREIRAVETFARAPGAAFLTPQLARIASVPQGFLEPSDLLGGELTLGSGATGRVTGISDAIWRFAVSGYRVVPRWLEGRKGMPVDLALVSEFRDICGRVAELLALFDEADTLLGRTLEATLTREALGLADEDRNE